MTLLVVVKVDEKTRIRMATIHETLKKRGHKIKRWQLWHQAVMALSRQVDSSKKWEPKK